MIKIIKPGLLASLQDLGRYGFQKYGVIASGVMDPYAHRIANLLVGNKENESTIEVTLLGPVIEFEEDALIAICGANLSPAINGKPVRLWRSILVKKGSQLRFGPHKSGCRAYLAVAGGFCVPNVMESKSTYLRASIGGFNGRALQAGDQVNVGSIGDTSNKILSYLSRRRPDHPFTEIDWSVASEMIPVFQSNPYIRVMKGRQYHLFSKESQELLFTQAFRITTNADRMGYRLEGPALGLKNANDMISEAVTSGTIQVPSDGNPIVLLADRQTTGGYPKIGQVATVDLPYMAQLKPGDQVNFTEISHEDAQRLYLHREKQIDKLKRGIALKLRDSL